MTIRLDLLLKIKVLKDGYVVENGTFEQLMEQKGYFCALYKVAQ